MSPALDDPLSAMEVWFLTGSQNLYGEQTFAQVAEQSRRSRPVWTAYPSRSSGSPSSPTRTAFAGSRSS